MRGLRCNFYNKSVETTHPSKPKKPAKHTVSTLVYQPNASAYAAALQGLIDEPMRRLRLGRAARNSSARYDWREISGAVLDVYRELGAVSDRRARTAA